MIRFGSVCSGIEAASSAWMPLGWRPAWLSEIDKAARAVLTAHHPDVPLHGDFTRLREAPEAVADIDVLVGGTPCQAFSVAGLRKSLADDRGNLTLEFVRLADAIDDVRAQRGQPGLVVVWENVPGVLSTKDNAFGCFLAAMVGHDAPLVPGRKQRWTDAGLVVGPRRAAAWRTLDAQYFGLAQRRERVFVVASAGDVLDPAQVLFEPEGVRRHSPPSREAGDGIARPLAAGLAGGSGYRNDADTADNLVAHPLRAQSQPSHRADNDTYVPVMAGLGVGPGYAQGAPLAFGGNNTGGGRRYRRLPDAPSRAV